MRPNTAPKKYRGDVIEDIVVRRKPTAPLVRTPIIVNPPATPKYPTSRPHVKTAKKGVSKRVNTKTQRVLLVAAAIVFIVGIAASIMGFKNNPKVIPGVKAAASQKNEEHTGDNPDEDTPTDLNAYKVAPDLPKKLSIPKIGVQSRVLAFADLSL